MKTRFFAMIVVLIPFLVAGCITANVPASSPVAVPHEIRLTVNGASLEKEKGDNLQKMMMIESVEMRLSRYCQLLNGKAYMTLTSTWWGSETLWNDLEILKHQNIKELVIYMNNDGGNAIEGMAMADEIRMAKGDIKVTIEGRGIVASAAIPIFLMGDYRIASKHTVFMVHPAHLWKGGSWMKEELKDLQAQAKMIEMQNDHYAEIMASRSRLNKKEALALLEKTTWITAEEAVAMGFVDEIR